MTGPRSTDRSLFRFCPFCATPLVRRKGEGIRRPVCVSCGYVQYRNPVVGVAAIVYESETAALLGADAVHLATGRAIEPARPRVLLARRAASYRGSYCLPCGYVEYDEEIREAVIRETLEETGLVVTPEEIIAVHSNFHDPDRQSVGIWFRVRPAGGSLRAGDDVDTLLFVPPSNPEVALAFPTDRLVLAQLSEREGQDSQNG